MLHCAMVRATCLATLLRIGSAVPLRWVTMTHLQQAVTKMFTTFSFLLLQLFFKAFMIESRIKKCKK